MITGRPDLKYDSPEFLERDLLNGSNKVALGACLAAPVVYVLLAFAVIREPPFPDPQALPGYLPLVFGLPGCAVLSIGMILYWGNRQRRALDRLKPLG